MLTLDRVSSSTKLALRQISEKGVTLSQEVRRMEAVKPDVLPELDEWTDEVFARLYDSPGCRDKPKDEQDPWGKQATATVRSQDQWSELQDVSSYHPAVAKAATTSLVRGVAKQIGLVNQKATARVEDVQAAIDATTGRMHDGDIREGDEDMLADLIVARTEAEQQRERLKLVGVSANVMQDALDAANKVAAVVRFASGFHKGGATEVTLDEVKDLSGVEVQTTNLIDVLGAMQLGGDIERVNVSSPHGGVVVGVTVGGDLRRLIPSEASKLAMPLTRNLMMKSILDEDAIVYEVADDERKQRGPVVILVDCSGSMRMSDCKANGVMRTRHQVAVALAAACVSRCFQQRREVVVIGFSDNAIQLKATGAKLAIEVSRLRITGGTNFIAAFKAATDAVKDMKGTADVLAITDGESNEVAEATSILRRSFPQARAVLAHVSNDAPRFGTNGWDLVMGRKDLLSGHGAKVLGELFSTGKRPQLKASAQIGMPVVKVNAIDDDDDLPF